MSRNLPKISLRAEHLAELKVLVVDDNINVQRLIADVLRAGGVGQVETAADGVRAFQDTRAIATIDPEALAALAH